MDSLRVFLQMDGYGGFVWPAFAATVLVMAVLLIATVRSLKVRESTLAALRAAADRTTRITPLEADDEA